MPYLAPTRLDEALDALTEGAAIIAGGTDWYPAQGTRPFAGTLLDVTRIEGMRGIARAADDKGWRIGAATTWTDVARADMLPPACDGLRAAARAVGGIQIQNAATVAGNLCNASPAADGVPPLLALDAEVELTGPRGARRLPLAEFVTGVRRTARAPDELVTALVLPDPPEGAHGSFVKLGARAYLVISIVMVAAVVSVTAGRVRGARIAVGAASPVAVRLPALEAALEDCALGEVDAVVAAHAPFPALTPVDDIRASAAYRHEAAAEAVRRALAAATRGDA
ncbi:FAD binding domain-containing protein [Roseivivax isoporae]|uniref:Xanthine dehydrogenase n=1 Tax=Roseivivax isoporae LMG 25204 TaxID=1449351 RepID=X7FCV1_9RHOB|nr:FAD binding domain-containing protein [Roseivivax isoporae]ETX30543.1 xanthine dehydrogenase [Roseivivax isoporae LMG 25204]